MITPAFGKVLVSILTLNHSMLFLPESIKKPDLSVAVIVDGNGTLAKNAQVLVPTLAGIDIREGDDVYRLMNASDVVAVCI